MSCLWCHNPEAQSFTSEGTKYSIQETIEIIKRDQPFYREDGGITLSGGEPLLQRRNDLVAFLRKVKENHINIAIETAGNVPWSSFEAVLPYVDLFLFDLKLVGHDELHKQFTNGDGKLIEDNARKLSARLPKEQIHFRMVPVAGYNDFSANVKATAELLKSCHQDSMTLLRYHNLYESKTEHARSLGISNEQSLASINKVARMFEKLKIRVNRYDLKPKTDKDLFTDRVHHLQEDIRNSKYHACFDTAKLKTAYYKRHGFDKPAPIHRAESLRYILNNKHIAIYPHELLVGNYTSKRVGGNVWIEYMNIGLPPVVLNYRNRKPKPYECDRRDILTYFLKLFPFWLKHEITSKLFDSRKDFLLFANEVIKKRQAMLLNMASIAHFILNTERILTLGTTGIIDEIRSKKSTSDFYEGALIALNGVEEFARRYGDRLKTMSDEETNKARSRELRQMSEICYRVPKHPAKTFHEALQSILLFHLAICTEAFENAVSFGRLDQTLYPYYINDIKRGTLTHERARELVACFILKLEELILLDDGSAGMQIGKFFEGQSPDETITIGGVDEKGLDAVNELTYIFIDACRLHPRSTNIEARINDKNPKLLLQKIAEVYMSGASQPAIYNDAVYFKTLRQHHDMTTKEIRNYSLVGCVEPTASTDHFGNTDCANFNLTIPFLYALKGEDYDLWRHHFLTQISKRVKSVSQLGGKLNPPRNMDQLLKRFRSHVNRLVSDVLNDHRKIEEALKAYFPIPLASSTFKSCVDNNSGLYEGGATHNSSGIQGMGITDVADSLMAINEVVVNKKLFTFQEIIDAVESNFEASNGNTKNREIREALLAVPKFGNDSAPETTKWMNTVLGIYTDSLKQVKHLPRNGRYVAGYYGMTVNEVYGKNTPALPSGRLRGKPIANSLCSHYGMRHFDLTSSFNSVSSLDFVNHAPNGTTLTSTIDSNSFNGRDGVKNLSSLFLGFFEQGGMQFQPNILNIDVLWDAYLHPEKHRDLVIRIAGYCAYFNDLSPELKLSVINRSYFGAHSDDAHRLGLAPGKPSSSQRAVPTDSLAEREDLAVHQIWTEDGAAFQSHRVGLLE